MLAVGTTLLGGNLTVDRQLNSGGFGNTYVVHNRLGKVFAMKEFFIKGINVWADGEVTVTVPDNKSIFESQRTKFEKEARRLSKINNAHIVKVYDLFYEKGTVYYTMDYIDGESLAERIRRTDLPLNEGEINKILFQVLDALSCVYGLEPPLLHLDLKPANIMQEKGGNVYLIDFGASKQIASDKGNETFSTSSAFAYTQGYAPIEQINGVMRYIGPWTDFYALGATLYNLLTSKSPKDVNIHEGEEGFNFPDNVSPKMRLLIAWMMSPNRKKRPQTVEEILEFLEKKDSVVKDRVSRDDTISEQHKTKGDSLLQKEKHTNNNSQGTCSPLSNLSLIKRFKTAINLQHPLTFLFTSFLILFSLFFLICPFIWPKENSSNPCKALYEDWGIFFMALNGLIVSVAAMGGKKWPLFWMGTILFLLIGYEEFSYFESIKELHKDLLFFVPLLFLFLSLKLKKGNKSFWSLMDNNLRDTFSKIIFFILSLGCLISSLLFLMKYREIKLDEKNRSELLSKMVEDLEKDFVLVEGGTFKMGATPEQGNGFDDDEMPIHEVTVSDYLISKFEVSQQLWITVMGTNPSNQESLDNPVESVSWDDCQEFIRKLNEKTGKNYRLPTEAEWEFAARGGINSKGYRYSGSNRIDEVAWNSNNSGDSIHLIGQKIPNELGIYDMSGNVQEWCQDYYGAYRDTPLTNPTGEDSGEFRVMRGGSSYASNECRISYRHYAIPTDKYCDVGLRLVKSTLLQSPSTNIDELSSKMSFAVNGVSFDMLRVDGGTFTMGATTEQSHDAESDEKPIHQVTLSTYSIGVTEVTQALWEAVMGTNPSNFKGKSRPVE